MAKIQFRPATSKDRPYLLDSFQRGFRSSSAHATGAHPNTIINLIEPLLLMWTTTIAVDNDDEILGWICHKDRAIAWINVKGPFRRHGIARALLATTGIGPGEVLCPFLPTKLVADGKTLNFPKFAESKDYVCRFRPYMPLDMLARELTEIAVDTCPGE